VKNLTGSCRVLAINTRSNRPQLHDIRAVGHVRTIGPDGRDGWDTFRNVQRVGLDPGTRGFQLEIQRVPNVHEGMPDLCDEGMPQL
jgi:hypothetical protein